MLKKIFSIVDSLFHKVVDKGRYKPTILSADETIDLILQKRLSIARYGDGEFSMMLGQAKNIRFQTANTDLSERLHSVFLTPNQNVLICIPKVFDWKDRLLLKHSARKFWSRYLKRQSSAFFNLMRQRSYYGDALVSRPYIDLLKIEHNYKKSANYFSKIKSLWNAKKVLIVEGELTRFGVGNPLLDNAQDVKRILCPAENCWACAPEILKTTLSVSKDFDLVILALGPTATVLANDLSLHGIQALDLGHLDIEYEWFLQKAITKSSVSGKYVNEAKDKNNVSPNNGREDLAFQSQVICKIPNQCAIKSTRV